MSDTPRTDAARFEALRGLALRQDCIPLKLGQELERELTHSLENQFKTQAEVERLKAGNHDLETQLARAHEELCQAGLREYGN